MADNNILLSPQTPVDTVANASKEGVLSNEEGQPPQPPLQQQEEDRQAPTATDDRQEPEMEELMIPQSPPHVQVPPVNNPGVGGGLKRDELPEDLHPPHDGAGCPSPQEVDSVIPPRNTRPPARYTDYDVSTLKTMVSDITDLLSNQMLTNQSDRTGF